MGKKKTLIIRDEDGNKYSVEVSKRVYDRAHADEQFCASVLQLVLEKAKNKNKKKVKASAIDIDTEFSGEPTQSTSQSSEPDAAGEPNPLSEHLIQHDEETSSTSYRAQWTRIQVLQLIASYKKFQSLLDNSTIRNEIVWKRIADDMGHHKGIEAMNKFKYLKALYTKKKDNMSAKDTGGTPMYFEYFEEFDEMFGKDPNIVPRSIASSSRIQEVDRQPGGQLSGNTENQEVNRSSNDTLDNIIEGSAQSPASPPKNKNRKRKDDSILEFLKQREEARERRHQQSLETVNKFNLLFEKFLEK